MVEQQNRWEKASGNSAGIINIIIVIIVLIAIPATTYFFVRKGLLESNASVLQGICVFDGYCAYCSFFGTLVCINTILQWTYMSNYVHDHECGQDGVTKDGRNFDKPRGYTQEKCEKARSAVNDWASATIGVYVIVLLICLCQAGICAFATMQANNANGIIKQGKAFVGAPRFSQSDIVACPGQTGAVVMGQPVTGQPIQATCGTPC